MVPGDVLAPILPFDVLHAEVHNAVVEVLYTEMCVAGGSFHFRDAVLNGQSAD